MINIAHVPSIVWNLTSSPYWKLKLTQKLQIDFTWWRVCLLWNLSAAAAGQSQFAEEWVHMSTNCSWRCSILTNPGPPLKIRDGGWYDQMQSTHGKFRDMQRIHLWTIRSAKMMSAYPTIMEFLLHFLKFILGCNVSPSPTIKNRKKNTILQ